MRRLITDPLNKEKEKITFNSRKKWLWLGIVIALLSPLSGLILGIAFWTEKDFKKEAKIILLVAVIWGLIFIYLSRWLTEQGYLPAY